MNSFTQHIPNFVDVDPPKAVPFETTDELLDIDKVQAHARRPGFSHFAMHGSSLMAINDDGYYWWVIGEIAEPDKVNLPQWEGAKYHAS